MPDGSGSGGALAGLAQVQRDCACEGIRRAARALTQFYEQALAESGLRATQLPILVALASSGPLPVNPLAEALLIDRTTLTRNLKVLRDDGLVEITEGEDRRTRVVAITAAGRQALRRALARWTQAQDAVTAGFGVHRLRALLDELAVLTDLVRP